MDHPNWTQGPEQGQPPSGPPTGPPGWGPPPPGTPWGSPHDQQFSQAQQFAQPAAQPYLGGYHGPDWIPELGVRIGSAGARIGAKAIDIALFVIIQFVIAFAAAAMTFSSGSQTFDARADFSFNTANGVVVALIVLLVDFLYNVVPTALFGGTPGKLLLGLRVIRKDGTAADLRTAFQRWTPIFALSLLGLMPHVIVGLFTTLSRFGLLITNLVLVLTDERRRSVYDHVGGTYVVATR